MDSPEYTLPGGAGIPTDFDGQYQLLDYYRLATDDQIINNVTDRIEVAHPYFPEIIGQTITVGRVKPDSEYRSSQPHAEADPYNCIVFLQPDEDVSMMTIFHELAHLAIQRLAWGGRDVPTTSEEFCSIFAVSRMPTNWLDQDRISYLGEPSAPREEWPDICQRALQYRAERGAGSHYVKKCEEWLGL